MLALALSHPGFALPLEKWQLSLSSISLKSPLKLRQSQSLAFRNKERSDRVSLQPDWDWDTQLDEDTGFSQVYFLKSPTSWTIFAETLWSKPYVFYTKFQTGLLPSCWSCLPVYMSDTKHLLLDLEHQEVPKMGREEKTKWVTLWKMIPLWLQSVHSLVSVGSGDTLQGDVWVCNKRTDQINLEALVFYNVRIYKINHLKSEIVPKCPVPRVFTHSWQRAHP